MLYYTHLAATLFFALLLFSKFGIMFLGVALISTLLPDIDTKHSRIGKKWFFRPLQFFLAHRGILHSFIFLILIGLVLFLFSKSVAYGFLLGYGLHILTDRLGIKSGSVIETGIFVVFLLGSLVLIGRLFFGI